MTTRFRNPWVDPRVLDVRPTDLEAYLRGAGWQQADSPTPRTLRFLSPAGTHARESVLMPTDVDDGPLLNLLVECVGTLAGWEGRYAGDLLADLLPAPAVGAANGYPHLQPAAKS